MLTNMTAHSDTSSPLHGNDMNSASGKGTWTKEEHERFLQATELFPQGPWKKIAEMVRTRTIRQTQTHAQKYREKLARHHRGLRTRSFGQTSQPPPLSSGGMHSASGAPRHLPSNVSAASSKSGRNPMLLPPSGHSSSGSGSFHHSPHNNTTSGHLRPAHVPSHHHNHHSMVWAPPQLPQLHSSTPSYSHENTSSYANSVHPPSHSYHSVSPSSSFAKQEPHGGQNFSQSMQYLMDFYEPANAPQAPHPHFPIEHNNHSYTVYNDPVDVYRRHNYQGDA